MASSWREVLKENYTSIFGATLLLIILGVTGYFLSPVFPRENLDTLLSVMIGAQASVLAIVISVTLISTQLVATRYAPRMATLPFRTPLFKGTFALFSASIILDSILLLGAAEAMNPFYPAVFAVALGLFVLVLLFLYFFVRGMVAISSPESLVTLFTETVSPGEYLSKCSDLADSPEKNAHPLQPLYRFIMSALSSGEYGTAKSALDQYEQFASETLTELDDDEVFSDPSVECKEQLFGPVLKEHLHSITIHAAEKDESQIVSAAIDAQVRLGKEGMSENRNQRIPRQALWGLRKTIMQSPVNGDDIVTINRVWPAVSELMLEETKYEHYKILRSGNDLIGQELLSNLNRSEEPKWHTSALREFFDNIYKAHKTVLENLAESHEFSELGLHKPSQRAPDSEDTVQQAGRTRDAVIKATSNFLQFRVENEYYPITEGNFRKTWQNLCIDAASLDAEEYATWLCQVLIEIAFIENSNRPYKQQDSNHRLLTGKKDNFLYWTRELTHIRSETSDPIVEKAFNNLSGYENQEEPSPIPYAGEPSERQKEYYSFNLSIRGYRDLNTESEYPDLIEKIRKASSIE
ncbi:DUF2254 family protein [Halobellus salinisoli]|uniref:DUF2254 family protein n=1 Tax=Halobellus salinisoli TaxID=3108500 RepID=UPI00300804F5